MTILVAIKDVENDCVYIGCDSQTTTGDLKRVGDNKIFKCKDNDDCLIANSGYTRNLQVLRNKNLFNEKGLLKLKLNNEDYTEDFLINNFVDNVISLDKFEDTPSIYMILAIKNKIFTITPYGTVSEKDDFATYGSGSRFASGCLYTLKKTNSNMTSIEKVICALESACEFSTGCSRPFYIMCTNDTNKIEKID